MVPLFDLLKQSDYRQSREFSYLDELPWMHNHSFHHDIKPTQQEAKYPEEVVLVLRMGIEEPRH